MSFKDKLKAQAEQALQKSKEGVSHGQAKVKEMQAKKAADRSGENADGATPPDAPAGNYSLDDI